MCVQCPAEPEGLPLSLALVTQEGVSRVWAEPHSPRPLNQSLAALEVRAIDFHYTNKCVHLYIFGINTNLAYILPTILI